MESLAKCNMLLYFSWLSCYRKCYIWTFMLESSISTKDKHWPTNGDSHCRLLIHKKLAYQNRKRNQLSNILLPLPAPVGSILPRAVQVRSLELAVGPIPRPQPARARWPFSLADWFISAAHHRSVSVRIPQ